MRIIPFLASLVVPAVAAAQTTVFTYQGQLKSAGAPAVGPHDLRFRLFDAALGGTQIGSTLCADNVPMANGFFTSDLDFGSVFGGAPRFLEIDARADTGQACGSTAGFVTLGPRQPITAAPHAMFAANAITAGSAQQLNGQPSSFYQNAANISTGTLLDARLSTNVTLLSGNQTFSGPKTFGAGLATSAFTMASGAGIGKVLTSDSVGSGTWQNPTIPLPLVANGSSAGSLMTITNLSGTTISANSTGGTAIVANGKGTVISAQTTDESGIGVKALAFNGNGASYGAIFQSNSTSGIGVYGFVAASAGPTKAILGECLSASGHAVYAAGRFAATGTKSFRIDHPEDPRNKYLVHYSSESPDATNFYSGTVQLGENGEAAVDLPLYFSRVNRDPRYTLTAIGAPMPLLHVAQEIDSAALDAGAAAAPGEPAPTCSFRIAGGVPRAKVSWRVEAIRNDLWARRYGAPVEEDKEGRERGTYQHPELYGKPRESSAFHRAETPEKR